MRTTQEIDLVPRQVLTREVQSLEYELDKALALLADSRVLIQRLQTDLASAEDLATQTPNAPAALVKARNDLIRLRERLAACTCGK
jgi:hypothetical protein